MPIKKNATHTHPVATEAIETCQSVTVNLCLLLQEEHMPEEVNIDELLDLQNDEERTKRLQVQPCSSDY